MIGKLVSTHLILNGLNAVGILLILVSLAILCSNQTSKVKAASCTGMPSVNQPNGHAVNWRLQEWLTFSDLGQNPRREIPIGPSRWTVTSRFRNGAQDNCFVEDWSVQKVVFQSSRDNQRGVIIDINNANAYGINFRVPSVLGPKNKKVKNNSGAWYCPGVPDSEWAQQRFPRCFTDAFSHFADLSFDIVPNGTDPDSDPTTQRWNPLGQYGLLFTSSNNLTPGRGYLPVEWLISGR